MKTAQSILAEWVSAKPSGFSMEEWRAYWSGVAATTNRVSLAEEADRMGEMNWDEVKLACHKS